MTTDHEETEGPDSRALLEEALDGVLDKDTLNVLLRDVLEIKKQARGWCGECKKAVTVEIPDSRAVVSSIAELLTQAKGRPGQESENDEQTVVNLYYIVPCEHGEESVRHNGVTLEPEEARRVMAEWADENPAMLADDARLNKMKGN